MDNLSVFVDCINDYIVRHDISVNKFSILIDTAERAVAKWISLSYFPTIECAVKVADLLDCSLDYLFGLSEYSTPVRRSIETCFIDRFDTLCKKRGVTHYRVAKECDFGESMISKWKRGKNPKTETLIKLASYFDCPLDYLAGREY